MKPENKKKLQHNAHHAETLRREHSEYYETVDDPEEYLRFRHFSDAGYNLPRAEPSSVSHENNFATMYGNNLSDVEYYEANALDGVGLQKSESDSEPQHAEPYADGHEDEEALRGAYGEEQPAVLPSQKPSSPEEIAQRVFTEHVESKGNCLFASVTFEPGEIIFAESPILAATPSLNPELWKLLEDMNNEKPFIMPPIWHLTAIHCMLHLNWKQRAGLERRFVPDPNEEASEDVLRINKALKLNLDPLKYQRTLNAWRFNGFGHHNVKNGLIMYDTVSYMAHSCGSSATWHYGENDTIVLRAKKLLKPGEEITISYIRDEDLLKPIHLRRKDLAPWQFVCNCNRCVSNFDHCRAFLCPACAAGDVCMKTDYDDKTETYYSSVMPCSVCEYEFTEEQISHYEELEYSYVARIEEMTTDNLLDCENVYSEACRVFTNHYKLFELDGLLYEAYKSRDMIPQAAHHLLKRIQFVSKAYNRLNFTLAGFWEELGDLYVQTVDCEDEMDGFNKNKIARAYENAFNMMLVLCGSEHEYTLSAHSKFEIINNLNWKHIQ